MNYKEYAITKIKADIRKTALDMKAVTGELKGIYEYCLENEGLDWFMVYETNEVVLDLKAKLNRLSNQAEELRFKLTKATK